MPRIPGLGAIVAFAFLVVPLIAVGWWLNHSRTETSPGAIPTDLDVVCLGRVDGERPIASLEPAATGRVAEIFVVEGQTVQAKDKILRLEDESLKLRVKEAEDALGAVDVEVDMALEEQKLQPRRRVLQEAAITAAKNRLSAARSLYRERQKAREFGTVSTAELTGADAEVKQLEHLVEVEAARLDELTALDTGLKVRAARAKQSMAQTSLELARQTLKECLLIAPTSGVVLRIQTSVGEMVAPGTPQPAIIFRPQSPMIIRAELDQEFLGRVKPGMKATIRDDVRADSPTWTGTVARLGGWLARKRSVLLEPGEINDVRTAECIISLDGKPEGLLIGQRMRVRIGK